MAYIFKLLTKIINSISLYIFFLLYIYIYIYIYIRVKKELRCASLWPNAPEPLQGETQVRGWALNPRSTRLDFVLIIFIFLKGPAFTFLIK
jgi:hypothetical protein